MEVYVNFSSLFYSRRFLILTTDIILLLFSSQVSYRIGTQGSICHLTSETPSDSNGERQVSPTSVYPTSSKSLGSQPNCGLGADINLYSSTFRLMGTVPM